MKLLLERIQLDWDVTIGQLSVDGRFFCWTCEDPVRDGFKVPGDTAIPYGTYTVEISWSPRFRRPLPMVLNVPGFRGIRIHPGNTAMDTEGCILPGCDRLPKGVGRSRQAFADLYRLLDEAGQRKETVTLEIPRQVP